MIKYLFSGCDQYISLGSIPDGSTCHLYDFCTGVRCCSDIPLLDRSINTWLIIDHCNYKLSVGFEKLSINVSLRDYEMGKQKDVIINGVFRIRWVLSITNDIVTTVRYMFTLLYFVLKVMACFTLYFAFTIHQAC